MGGVGARMAVVVGTYCCVTGKLCGRKVSFTLVPDQLETLLNIAAAVAAVATVAAFPPFLSRSIYLYIRTYLYIHIWPYILILTYLYIIHI